MKKPGFFALQAICDIIFSVLYYAVGNNGSYTVNGILAGLLLFFAVQIVFIVLVLKNKWGTGWVVLSAVIGLLLNPISFVLISMLIIAAVK